MFVFNHRHRYDMAYHSISYRVISYHMSLYMYMCVCVCVCVYIYLCIYIYIYIHIHVYTSISVCLSVSLSLSTYFSLSLYIYIYTHTYATHETNTPRLVLGAGARASTQRISPGFNTVELVPSLSTQPEKAQRQLQWWAP